METLMPHETTTFAAALGMLERRRADEADYYDIAKMRETDRRIAALTGSRPNSWKNEVANGETTLGLAEWQEKKIVAARRTAYHDAHRAGRMDAFEQIAAVINNGTSADGWDIGILENIDRMLAANGITLVECETL